MAPLSRDDYHQGAILEVLKVDIEYIRFNYDCDYIAGTIYKILKSGYRVRGETLGHPYKRVSIFGKNYQSHRVIWAHYYRSQPPKMIDHIDGDPKNNAISNLRSATATQNQNNRKIASNNTSGFTGVCYIKKINKYKSTIYHKNKPIHLGCFRTANEAYEAYLEKKSEIHGEEWGRSL